MPHLAAAAHLAVARSGKPLVPDAEQRQVLRGDRVVASGLGVPNDVAEDRGGNLVVAEFEARRVSVVDARGRVRTLAGYRVSSSAPAERRFCIEKHKRLILGGQ